MKRSQLEHAIRTSCQIIRQQEVIVVGSQAILGTYDENQLPAEATMSLECDILPIASNNEETARLADAIEGVAGEWSPFEREHGFSIDGVDLTTVIFPVGWRTRLVKVQNENTAALSGQPQFTGALLAANLVDLQTLQERVRSVDARFLAAADRATQWLTTFG